MASNAANATKKAVTTLIKAKLGVLTLKAKLIALGVGLVLFLVIVMTLGVVSIINTVVGGSTASNTGS